MKFDKHQLSEVLYVKPVCTLNELFTHVSLMCEHFKFKTPTRIELLILARELASEDERILITSNKPVWVIQRHLRRFKYE
jgi:hypothetical protein